MTIKQLALRVQSLYDAGLCAFDNELAQALVDLGDRAREIADLEVSCRKLTAALALATTGLVDLHNGYPPKEFAAIHGTGLGRLIAQLVTLLRARGVDDDRGWSCPETSDIPVVFGGSPARNRWPFAFTPDGLHVNGRRDLEFVIANGIAAARLAEMTIATNERFEGVIDASEQAFGELNDERYAAVLESFIATVVKTAATTTTQQEGGAS
jgi:hypothetical protein